MVDRPNSGSFSFLSAEERQARAASYELFEAIHPRTLCSLSRRRGYFEKKSTCALESLLFTFFFSFFFYFSVQAVRVEKILLLSFFLFFPFFFLVLVLDRLLSLFLLLLSFLSFFFFLFYLIFLFKDSFALFAEVLECFVVFVFFCKMRILTTRSPPPHTLIMPAQGEYRLTSRTLLQEGNACEQREKFSRKIVNKSCLESISNIRLYELYTSLFYHDKSTLIIV